MHVQPCRILLSAIRQIGYTNHNLCRRMRGMTSLRPTRRGWNCSGPGLVNESSPHRCYYSCRVGSAAIREADQSSWRGYKKRQASALEVSLSSSHHAIQTPSNINFHSIPIPTFSTNQQPFTSINMGGCGQCSNTNCACTTGNCNC
jgi:hypothetical protein